MLDHAGYAGEAAERWRNAAGAALAGDIAALQLMTLDVVLSPADGKDRCAAKRCHTRPIVSKLCSNQPGQA